MGLISPTPRQGSWVRSDEYSGPWTAQPRQGSWVRSDEVTFVVTGKYVGIVAK